MIQNMQDDHEDEKLPTLKSLYHEHQLGVLALAKLSGLPIDAIRALFSSKVRVSREMAQQAVDLVNELTGKQYKLEDIDIPFMGNDELYREINTFFMIQGYDRQSE